MFYMANFKLQSSTSKFLEIFKSQVSISIFFIKVSFLKFRLYCKVWFSMFLENLDFARNRWPLQLPIRKANVPICPIAPIAAHHPNRLTYFVWLDRPSARMNFKEIKSRPWRTRFWLLFPSTRLVQSVRKDTTGTLFPVAILAQGAFFLFGVIYTHNI